LAAAKAVIDSKKPAYDAAEANLAAATATAARIRASYDDALALIATAIAKPDAAVMAELDAANARIAHLNMKLGRTERNQAEVNAHLQEQIDAGGETTLALSRELADLSDADVGLQVQIDELIASNAMQADIDAAVQAWILHMCPRLRDDHVYSYKKECAAVKATTP
jgi:predicted  nucleic acid-binding Zn-ribbon protein